MIIRPTLTVLVGSVFGLVAGAAVYGAVSTASGATSTTVKPAKATVASPAAAARCAAGQKLEGGVCVIHVVRTVVVAAPSTAGAETGALSAVAGADQSAGPAASGDPEKEVGDHAADATEGAEDASDDGGSDLSGQAQDAGEAASDDDSSDGPRG